MMKRFISILVIIAMVFTMTATVFANPGQNPNKNPGSPSVSQDGVTITVTGGGNNLVILAIDNVTGESVVIPRAGNGTFSQSFEVFGYAVDIQVQGNSLKGFTAEELPCECSYSYVVTDPTCTNGGYTTYTCTECGDSYVSDETDALGHNHVGKVTKEPKPGNGGEGERVYVCTRCGDTYTVVIPALNNNGNGNDNGTGEKNYACSTNANNPNDDICHCCN